MEKKYYYGNAISDYGMEHGYVDYGTFSKAFNCVLNNEVISSTYDIGYWKQISGQIDNSEEIEELGKKLDELVEQNEDNPSQILEDEINEIEEEIEEPTIEKKAEQPIPQFNYEKKEEPETYASDDNIEVDQSDILNILVQADRKILNEVQEKWPVIRRYMANMNTAKAASMLSQGRPVAASRDGLIIEFELMPDVNAANYYKNYKQLSSLIKDVLGHEYKFIGMQHDAWLEMRQHYIQLARSKQLPQARPITLKHIDGYDLKRVDLNDAQKYALDMFGEDIVEFKED